MNKDADRLDERIAELEERLAEMERGARIRERARTRFDRVVPPEAMHHFRSAGREQLLGVRTVVDHWIRAEALASPKQGPRDSAFQ